MIGKSPFECHLGQKNVLQEGHGKLKKTFYIIKFSYFTILINAKIYHFDIANRLGKK